jgi:RNA polymerase sigma-70 factor (ECF subfamily)
MSGTFWSWATRAPAVDIDEWVRTHYDAVYAFSRRRVGPDLAEDVTQETFLVAQRKLRAYRTEVSPRTFLLGIAVRIAANALRKHRREVDIEWFQANPSNDPSAEWIDVLELRRALDQLSDDHRLVVQLHEFEGLTYDEIAAVLDIPSGTVKSRLHHAFAKLRQTLLDPETPR